jgi:hypothetical protein
MYQGKAGRLAPPADEDNPQELKAKSSIIPALPNTFAGARNLYV